MRCQILAGVLCNGVAGLPCGLTSEGLKIQAAARSTSSEPPAASFYLLVRRKPSTPQSDGPAVPSSRLSRRCRWVLQRLQVFLQISQLPCGREKDSRSFIHKALRVSMPNVCPSENGGLSRMGRRCRAVVAEQCVYSSKKVVTPPLPADIASTLASSGVDHRTSICVELCRYSLRVRCCYEIECDFVFRLVVPSLLSTPLSDVTCDDTTSKSRSPK